MLIYKVQFTFRYALTVWYIDREERREYAHRVRTKNRESDGLWLSVELLELFDFQNWEVRNLWKAAYAGDVDTVKQSIHVHWFLQIEIP